MNSGSSRSASNFASSSPSNRCPPLSRLPAGGKQAPPYTRQQSVAAGLSTGSLRIGNGSWWLLLTSAPLLALNVLLILGLWQWILRQPAPPDWSQLHLAGQLIASGHSPYDQPAGWFFRWSPLAAWALIPLTALPPFIWQTAQLASLAALPRRIALVALASFPFWADVQAANVLTFALVLAWLALRGHRTAQVTYLALCLLVPRPLMLPVAAWLLWREPWLRWPFAGMAALSVIGAVATGYAGEWFGILLRSSSQQMPGSFGPAALLGLWWLPIGLALAAWLTWRGRLGLASLAASPYLLGYYWLFALLELRGLPEVIEVGLGGRHVAVVIRPDPEAGGRNRQRA